MTDKEILPAPQQLLNDILEMKKTLEEGYETEVSPNEKLTMPSSVFRTHNPKTLKVGRDLAVFGQAYLPQVDFNRALDEVNRTQALQYWYLLTVMSGVGPVWIKGPAYLGYLHSFSPTDMTPAGAEVTFEFKILELLDESREEGSQSGTDDRHGDDRPS